ncbi:MAG: hypothetical protein IJG70_05730 [Kiritimatiellae bacterium]|nr:hypothetical protein [Kiritimatiellia bacterium]
MISRPNCSLLSHAANYTIFAALCVGFRVRFPPRLILLRLKAAIAAPVFCANNIAEGLETAA